MARGTSEKTVKERVKRLLKKYGVTYFMPVQSGYGGTALDFICCIKGRYFEVETKAPGKHPTARQLLRMDEVKDAGGAVFVVGEEYDGIDKNFSGEEVLETWLGLAQL